jgi:CRP-like cAMP-binding protein/serine/threonine protein kinase
MGNEQSGEAGEGGAGRRSSVSMGGKEDDAGRESMQAHGSVTSRLGGTLASMNSSSSSTPPPSRKQSIFGVSSPPSDPGTKSRLQSKQKLSQLLSNNKTVETPATGGIAGAISGAFRRSSTVIDNMSCHAAWLWRKNESTTNEQGPFIKVWCVIDKGELIYYDKEPPGGGRCNDPSARGYIYIGKGSSLLLVDDDPNMDSWSGMGRCCFNIQEENGGVSATFSAGTDSARNEFTARIYKANEGFEHRSTQRIADMKKKNERKSSGRRSLSRGSTPEKSSDDDGLGDEPKHISIQYEFVEPPSRTGPLKKRAIGGIMGYRNIKQRWFKLEAGELRYYDNESLKPSRLKGTVSLKDKASLAPMETGRPLKMKILFGEGKNIVMFSDTPEEAESWRRDFLETIRIFEGASSQYKDKKRKKNVSMNRKIEVEGEDGPTERNSSSNLLSRSVRTTMTESSKEVLKIALHGHFLLAEFDMDGHNALLEELTFLPMISGDVVIWQNTWGDYFYILESGSAQVIKDGKIVNTLPEGKGFGEMALVNDVLRTASIRCADNCKMWAIGRDRFRSIVTEQETISRQKKIDSLGSIELFGNLTFKTMGRVADSLHVVYFDEEGQKIFKQGDPGDAFYIVRDGMVSIKIGYSEVARLGPGSGFGERALINDEPRAGTALTVEPNVVCYKLDRERFIDLLGEFAQAIDENFAIEALQKVVLFKGMDEMQLNTIASSMGKEVFKEGSVIFHQDEIGEDFYIIVSGIVKIVVNHAVVGELTAGQYFGEKALLAKSGAGLRSATIIVASSRLVALSLNRKLFTQLIGPLEDVLTKESIAQEKMQSKRNSIRASIFSKAPKGVTGSFITKKVPGTFFSDLVPPLKCTGCSELFALQTLGKGEFSAISLVSHESYPEEYFALKRIPKMEIGELAFDCIFNMKNFQSELGGGFDQVKGVEVEATVPYFTKLFATFSDASNFYTLSEVNLGGDLHNVYYHTNFLPKTAIGGVSGTVAAFYVSSMLAALNHMHGKNIIYRNMRMENICISEHGGIKLTDFSFCKKLDGDLATTNTICGTGEYLSPEMVLGKPYNKSTDFWSLGVFCFELIAGKTPFEDPTLAGIYKNILNSAVVVSREMDAAAAKDVPGTFSDIAQDFIINLLQEKGSTRLGMLKDGAQGAWQHPFLSTKMITQKGLDSEVIDPPYYPDLEGGAHVVGFEIFDEDETDDIMFQDGNVVPYKGEYDISTF